jgi:hypothetical protein
MLGTMTGTEPSPQLARALIRTLTRGTAIPAGVRYLHVGHTKWLAAQQELLDELSSDGHSDTKFVRGAYGAGKSHFLSVVQDHARSAGWMTSHVECKIDGVQIDRFETIYATITKKLLADESNGSRDMPSGTNVLRTLLDRWTTALLAKVGVNPSGIRRPIDAEDRAYAELNRGILRSNLPAEFTKAAAVYVRATLADDLDSQVAIANWVQGTPDRVRIPEHYLYRPVMGPRRAGSMFDLRPIAKGTAREMMRGLVWLIRQSGFRGLVLCIDEIEEITKLGTRRREDQALQALRDFVDNAGSEVGYDHLCMYLAATPEMFDNPNYFPRYDALATRIQPVTKELNWRGTVIDLDRTPLQQAELRQVGAKIRLIHACGYPNGPAAMMSDTTVGDFVDEVGRSKFRVAKPRLLARVLVDELERARQADHDYLPPRDLGLVVQQTAERILSEANA